MGDVTPTFPTCLPWDAVAARAAQVALKEAGRGRGRALRGPRGDRVPSRPSGFTGSCAPPSPPWGAGRAPGQRGAARVRPGQERLGWRGTARGRGSRRRSRLGGQSWAPGVGLSRQRVQPGASPSPAARGPGGAGLCSGAARGAAPRPRRTPSSLAAPRVRDADSATGQRLVRASAPVPCDRHRVTWGISPFAE